MKIIFHVIIETAHNCVWPIKLTLESWYIRFKKQTNIRWQCVVAYCSITFFCLNSSQRGLQMPVNRQREGNENNDYNTPTVFNVAQISRWQPAHSEARWIEKRPSLQSCWLPFSSSFLLFFTLPKNGLLLLNIVVSFRVGVLGALEESYLIIWPYFMDPILISLSGITNGGIQWRAFVWRWVAGYTLYMFTHSCIYTYICLCVSSRVSKCVCQCPHRCVSFNQARKSGADPSGETISACEL